jgi:hypothetical protein
MVRTFERAERLNANLEERAIDIVEEHKANKGTERLTGSRVRSRISDQIEFGLGRTVANRSDVVFVRNSHFFNWKVTWYFIKTKQLHSKYATGECPKTWTIKEYHQ